MFEDSMMESSGRLKTKTGRWMWVTGFVNLAIIATMILIPLLYPEALPSTAMTAMLVAPPPPPPPPPPPCPADVHAAAGQTCPTEGQACRDDAKPGVVGIVCKGATWVEGELPHPPCCKR